MRRMDRKIIKQILCIILFITATIGCSNEPKRDTNVNMNNAISAGNDVLEQFVNIEALIPIRDKDVLLTTYDKILVSDSLVYIQDSERILVLDKSGLLRSEINKVGAGPGEYISIEDFEIDKQGNIILFSSSEQSIIIYTSNGDFVSKAKVCDGTDFCLLEDGGIAFFRNIHSDTIVSIYDGNLMLKESYKSINEQPNILLETGGEIFEYNKSLYFVTPFDYNIYRCDRNVYIPFLSFDFGEKNMSFDIIKEKDRRKLIKLLRENKKVYFIESLNLYNNNCFLKTSLGEVIINCIDENKTYFFDKLKLPYNCFFGSSIFRSGNGRFATFISSSNIENALMSMPNDELKKYHFLDVLRETGIDEYLDNDWIAIGQFK